MEDAAYRKDILITPEPRTPLTLEFAPEIPDDETSHSAPIVVCEPSFRHAGAIFLGAHPLGPTHRLGVHLAPDEARRVRDHLNKLLMEPGEPRDPTYVESGRPSMVTRAVERYRRRRLRRKGRKRFVFRTEFQIGDIQGVIGRMRD